MKCECCGKDLGEITFDQAFKLPDEIWALSEDERKQRAQYDSDLCQLDERYFIRGVASFPVQGTDQTFRWGLWVEVPAEQFFDYVKHFNADNSAAAPYIGKAANSLPHYPETRGLEMRVQPGNQTQRPLFSCINPAHPLSQDQLNGITLQQVHAFQ